MYYPEIHLPVPEGSHFERNAPNGDGVFYLRYRVRSYRDENGKKKHERIFLGKIFKDQETGLEYLCPSDDYYLKYKKEPLPVGAVIRKRGRPKQTNKPTKTYFEQQDSIGFGYMLACHKIVKDLKLDELLKDAFGNLATSIIAVGSFFAAGAPGGLTNIDHFTKKNMCFTSKIISSDDLCDLYSNLHQSMRDDFFRNWIKLCCANDCVCYDVTSISNYSERMPFVAWGYNRDKEALPQFNVGMFCTIKSKMPVYFCQYNGNINDFTNFPYVINQAKQVGIGSDSKLTLVIDGGFAVPETIENAVKNGFDLIVGAPCDFGVRIKESLLAWRRNSSKADAHIIRRGTESIRYYEEPMTIGRVKTRLILYKSPLAAIAQETSLTTLVNRLESELNDRNWISSSGEEKFKPFFFFFQREDKGFDFKLDDHVFKESLQLCGCFALFCTRKDLDSEQVLSLYRDKDYVEKAFAALKNDILNERMYTKSFDSTNGKLFLAFIGLIIRKTLESKLRAYLNKNRIGLDSAIDRLSDISCRKDGETWILDKALTKQQKELVEILQLPVSYLNQI